MISSPHGTFIYEISLYLNIPFPRLRKCFPKTANIYFCYVIAFIDDSEKSLGKIAIKLA